MASYELLPHTAERISALRGDTEEQPGNAQKGDSIDVIEAHQHNRNSVASSGTEVAKTSAAEPGGDQFGTLSERKKATSKPTAGSDVEDDCPQAEPFDKETGTKSSWRYTTFSWTDGWLCEIASLALSIAILVALVVLFALWNNTLTSTWTAWLSFSTVVAILAKAAQIALGVPVASCVGQLAWMHFHENIEPLQHNSLLSFQRFDSATRGSLGTLRLMFAAPTWMVFLCLLVVIPGLGFEAAAQQCLYVQSPTVIPILAQLVGGYFWNTSGNNAVVSDSLKGAAISAFAFRSQDGLGDVQLTQAILPTSLDYSCATANCAPPPYATLSLCSTCEDVTPELTVESSGLAASLPNGGRLDFNQSTLSITSEQVNYNYNSSSSWTGTLTLANFTMIEPAYWGLNTTTFPYSNTFVAQRCLITLCTNVYKLNGSGNSAAASGINEILLASVTQCSGTSVGNVGNSYGLIWNLPVPKGTVLRYPDHSTEKWQGDPSHIAGYSSYYGTYTANYVIDNSTIRYLSAFLSSLFNGTASQRWRDFGPIPDNPSIYAQEEAGTGFWNALSYVFISYGDSDSKYVATRIGADISNIVTSMANWMRDFDVEGAGYGNQYRGVQQNTYLIRWNWFALPAAVELLTVLLLFLTIYSTHKRKLPVWKTSALAVMFQGIAHKEGTGTWDFPNVSDMERFAAGERVRLVKASSGYQLVDMEQEP